MRRLFIAVYAMIAVLVTARSEAYAADQNAWCRQGWLLMHKASGYSAHTAPDQWNIDLIFKAKDAFYRCSQEEPRGTYRRFEGYYGWAEATRSLAQTAHFLSVDVIIRHAKNSRKTFDDMHQLAVTFAREAVKVLDPDSTAQFTEGSYDPDTLSAIEHAIGEARAHAFDIKQRVLATTFDSIPRNYAEMKAFDRSDRGVYWGIHQLIGLSDEEMCSEPAQGPAVKNPAPDDVALGAQSDTPTHARTRIQVGVNTDGSIAAAHIVQSSGNCDTDASKMTRAYETTFTPARRKCKDVPGTIIVEY